MDVFHGKNHWARIYSQIFFVSVSFPYLDECGDSPTTNGSGDSMEPRACPIVLPLIPYVTRKVISKSYKRRSIETELRII